MRPGEAVDITAIIVTFNSARFIGDLLADLRAVRRWCRLRVVVVDNGSSDDSVAVVASHDDVVIIHDHGNVGYAAAINLGMRAAGECSALLVLNPDVRLSRGAVLRLCQRLAQPEVAVVIPRMVDADRTTFPSLRREPSLLRAFGDAVFGCRFRRRPGWLTETCWAEEDYELPHEIDWATGAVMFICATVARKVGPWDERFFLYSEETDFLRRVRAAGRQVWYEPKAQVAHFGGGSGVSVGLRALMIVNRVRYVEAHHSQLYGCCFRLATLLSCALRCHQPGQRHALGALLRRGHVARLLAQWGSGSSQGVALAGGSLHARSADPALKTQRFPG